MRHPADFRNLLVRRTRGLTLVEVLIALVLMILLSIITVAGMIMHARMAQSSIEQEKILESSRRFIDVLQVAALDTTVVRIDNGPDGAGTVLTLQKPDPDNAGAVITTQYSYVDGDNDPNTIKDNMIVVRDRDTPLLSTGDMVVPYCSKVAGVNVFRQISGASKPLYEVNVRVGDRSQGSIADDAVTGHGYQSFLIKANFSGL